MKVFDLKYLCIVVIMGMLAYGISAADDIFNQSINIYFDGSEEPVVDASESDAKIEQKNGYVNITPKTEGVEVVLSGSSTAGGVKVDGDYPVRFVLNGLDLSCSDSAIVRSTSTNTCYVVLPKGTTSILTEGSKNSNKGVLMSKGSILISGTGTLKLVGTANKHAIYSANGSVTIREGEVIVENAGGDAIHAETDFQMDNGTLSILKPASDGVDCAGGITVNGGSITYENSEADTKGLKCDGNIEFNGGLLSMSIPTAQTKGIKCADLAMNGGAMLFDLSGAVYLEQVVTLKTNSTTGAVTTNSTYISPSYCTAIKCSGNAKVNAGKITITHSGMAGKGVSVDGDFTMSGGALDIYVSGSCSSTYKNSSSQTDIAAADCLTAGGDMTLTGGKITAIATGNAGDAITCDGVMTVGINGGNSATPVIKASTSGQKVVLSGSGMHANYANPKAIKSGGNMDIYGGQFVVSTLYDGGEGIESKGTLTIYDGTLEIEAYDDCINAAKSLVIKGGTIYCYSSGNDGIDSNGTIEISGGLIVSSGSTAPEEGLDCDQNTFKITGGTIIGVGGATSTPTSSVCAQRSVIYTGTGTADTIFKITDASGNNILVYKIPRSYAGNSGVRSFAVTAGGRPGFPDGGSGGGMTMLISLPDFTSNVTYTVYSGGTVSGGTEFHGYYTGATVSGGTSITTFKPSSMVTKVTGK
jgi:hypothetical protein